MAGPHRKNAAEKVMAAAAKALGKAQSGMKEWKVALPSGFDSWTRLEAIALQAAMQVDLSPGPRQSLKTKPGSVHYHLTCPGQTGTLELTIWPERQLIWLSVHANRAADWTDGAADALSAALARSIQNG